MKLLIGWNGTSESRDGLQLAAELAVALEASLVVACVIDAGALPLQRDAKREEWVERFSDLFRSAQQELGDLQFTPREDFGPPGATLRELALEEDGDMIVLGSSHRGAVGRVLFGSVANELLQGAPCPIAVAPRDYARWPHVGIGTIGVGYDGSRETRAALAAASQIANALGDEVNVISVAPDYALSDLPLGPLEPVRDDALQRPARGLSELPREVRGDAKVAIGDPAAVLEEQGVALDLLVVGSRGHGRLRSVIEGAVAPQLVTTAPCPVVVVPHGAGGELVGSAAS